MGQAVVRDGIEYSPTNNRMLYHPEYHDNHTARYTEDDMIYMCSMHGSMTLHDIGLALGRTASAIGMKISYLKKSGKYDHYRRLGQ